ncbi:hypothetical protein Meth11DRAFT_0504 [Methylophilaceae bacterium 11]|nr:hypothetical protein Meth11DRAFT_0504 [Methylophilaceae bacterium 11]
MQSSLAEFLGSTERTIDEMLIKLKQLIRRLALFNKKTSQEITMKLLNKLRDLRNERIQAMEMHRANYAHEAIGLGTVTVYDIVRLHAEMDTYERLYQQRVER